MLLLEVLARRRAARRRLGRGHGTRIINYLKSLAIAIARRRGLAAGLITQSDIQPGFGGGARGEFWRADVPAGDASRRPCSPRRSTEWDTANEVRKRGADALLALSRRTVERGCARCARRARSGRRRSTYATTTDTRATRDASTCVSAAA